MEPTLMLRCTQQPAGLITRSRYPARSLWKLQLLYRVCPQPTSLRLSLHRKTAPQLTQGNLPTWPAKLSSWFNSQWVRLQCARESVVRLAGSQPSFLLPNVIASKQGLASGSQRTAQSIQLKHKSLSLEVNLRRWLFWLLTRWVWRVETEMGQLSVVTAHTVSHR